jgi:hypothetical protein
MDLTPKISTIPGWSIFYCCTPAASSNDNNDDNDDGYDGFLWSAPSIKVVTLGGSKDFFGGSSSQAAAETPTTACSSDDTTDDDCYSFNVVQCSSPPSKTTAAVVQPSEEVRDDVPPQTTPDKKMPCETLESSCSNPSTPFIGVVEIITPKSRKQLQEGYEIKRTSKFVNTTEEEGSVTSEDDDDISNDQDELMHNLYNIDQDSFDEQNQSPIKYDTSNVEKNEIHNIIELPTIDAMSKLGLLHYFNRRSAFSDTTNTNKGYDTNEDDELSDEEDKFYDSLESLGDEDSDDDDDDDDDSSTNNTTQQTSSPLINSTPSNNNKQKREFRTMTTRELQFVDMSFEVIPSLKKND